MTMRQPVPAAAVPFLLTGLLTAVPAQAQVRAEQVPLVIEGAPLLGPPPVPVLVLPPAAPFVPAVTVPPPSLPSPVKALIEEAMKGDDQSMVDNLVKVAIKTDPYDKAEIEALQKAYKERQTKLAADKKAAEEKRIRESRLTQLWAGSLEAGGFRNTGNTRNIGYSIALKLDRKGIKWEHILLANADYEKDDHTLAKSQYSASYQARYTLDDALFTYGKVMYERDKIQGFENRFTVSPGLGYRFLKRKNVTLSAEIGPAIRQTDYITDISQTTWSIATSLDLAWQINSHVKLTEDANTYTGSDDNTFKSATSLEAAMTKRLSLKVTYSWQHETRPPDDTYKTDTITRFTLAYRIGGGQTSGSTAAAAATAAH